MAFNKQKVLDSAQKFLGQGKIPQAIAEYQQILRHEPKDQVTLMTVGDLFVRSGETQQALEFYERLAQLFLGDGFISKSIAIYKKIAKIAPEETHPLEKLAELYVQQGVMSEARPLYLQMAEAHLKANRQPQAVAVLRKLLDLEPDNLRVQLKLAELYQAIGQKDAASLAYLNSAHRIFDRGDFPEARKMAERALAVQPKNARATTLKARAVAALGDSKEAITLLESLPEGAAGIESTRYLSELYIQAGKGACAVDLAKKMLARAPENYAPVFGIAQQLIDGGDAAAGLTLLGEIREAMMVAGDNDRLTRALGSAADRLAGRIEPLEWLVDAYRRANDTVRYPGALEQLAEARAAAGENERALELFEELLKLQPEDADTRRSLNQVRQKLGLEVVLEEGGAPPAPVEVSAESAPPPFAAEMEVVPVEAAPVPVEEATPDADTQRFITQALTDVDLFSSYGLTQKAIDLLESVVQRAPRHLATLEKLLDLYLGAGNDRRTAELAAQLEQIHTEQGDAAKADRFSELRRRYQRAAGVTAEELAPAPPPPPPAEFAIPTVATEPAPVVEAEVVSEVQAQPAEEAAVHEVDLSEEWAALSTEQPAETPAAPVVEAQPAEEEVVLEVEAEAAPVEPVPVEPPTPAPEPEPKVHAEEYELELTPAAPAEPAPAEAKGPMTSTDFFSDLAAEGEIELAPAPKETAKPREAAAAAAAAAAPAEQGGQLKEVFDEFRAELGEMGEEKEDPETHYNLGIAYREMGLLEEAIGEFQKVAKSIQGGPQFRYAMQCCTLLGLSFMDKGQPGIAAMWYRKALETPGLDQETILALRYDLGVSLEAAGEAKAALDSFNQVYAMNIDYRDVGERIANLQKAR